LILTAFPESGEVVPKRGAPEKRDLPSDEALVEQEGPKGKLMFSSERERYGWPQRKPGLIRRTVQKI